MEANFITKISDFKGSFRHTISNENNYFIECSYVGNHVFVHGKVDMN